MEVIHQVLGHIGLKPVLSQVMNMDQTTVVKIISLNLVEALAHKPLPQHQLAVTHAEVDSTLLIPVIYISEKHHTVLLKMKLKS